MAITPSSLHREKGALSSLCVDAERKTNMKRKIVYLLLGLSSMALVSCAGGGNGSESEKRTLKIEFVKAGFGLTPYEKLAEAFMKENPDVQVKLVPNAEMASTTATKVQTGQNVSDVMIYNRTVNDIRLWAKKGYIHDISDLMDKEVEGGQTLKQVLDGNALNTSAYDGSYWTIPEYYNINGFVYNATLFENKGWSVPKTSKELKDLCKKIASTKIAGSEIKPIVYCGAGADGYLYYAVDGWRARYEGISNLKKFEALDSPEVYSPENSVGKIKGYTLLKEFFYDSGWAVNGSMELGAIEGQSKLLTYEAAMMLNGSWFENEMAGYMNDNSPTFKMFAIPELSDDSGNVLRSSSFISNEAGEGVIDAEFVGNMFIPEKASNKSDAEKFLLFASKQSSLELYTKYSNAVRPFKNYDYSSSNPAFSSMSEFGKSVLDIASSNVIHVYDTKADIAIVGKASLYPQGGYWNKRIYQNPALYTPEYCIQSDYDYAKSNWNSWLEYAAEELKKN